MTAVHGKLMSRIDLPRGSHVLVYEPLPGLVPVVRHRRLSKEKTALAQTMAMERQQCLKSLRAAGACVVLDCVDPDHSAADRDNPPPAFQYLLQNFQQAGQGIAVTKLDRLLRHPYWAEDLIKTYENRRDLVWVCDDPTVDMTTDEGRSNVRKRTAEALAEVEAGKRRQRDRHQQLRDYRQPVFAHRPFGLEKVDDEWVLKSSEVALVEEAVAWLLSGQDMGRLAGDWLTRGIVSSKGKPFSAKTLRMLLLNPRNAGYLSDGRRQYPGGPLINADGIARDDDGRKVFALHPPLMSVARWEKVVAAYAEKATSYVATRRALSGILRCGLCGHRMGGSNAGRPGHWYYICPNGKGLPSCGKVRITGNYVDRLVGPMIMERARRAGRAEKLPEAKPWPEADRLAEKLEQRRLLQEKLNNDSIDPDEYEAEMASVTPLIARLQRDQRAWLKSHPEPVSTMPVPVGTWEQIVDVTIQQDLARASLSRVRILPAAVKGRGALTPDRIRIAPEDWRI